MPPRYVTPENVNAFETQVLKAVKSYYAAMRRDVNGRDLQRYYLKEHTERKVSVTLKRLADAGLLIRESHRAENNATLAHTYFPLTAKDVTR